MDHHLSTEAADGGGNSRNGYGKKTVLTDTGKLGIAISGILGRGIGSRPSIRS